MAELNNVTEQIKIMPLQKKAALVVVAALVIAAVVMLIAWFQKADYQLLFAGLSQEDGGAIIQKLTELRVPYRTEGGGIMVPADKVYELRLQLASQGLPQGGGVGFELFDKTSFTTTDFVQKLNYQRALQGELARTIRSLSEIDQCRVHLALPEKSLFMQKDSQPKASVLVKLKPGRRLSQAQVQGIVRLVSSSIDGLDPKDVTIVSNTGEMLTAAAAADESLAVSSDQFAYQRNYEKELETNLVSMLEPVIGKGKVRARVSAAIDFTKLEKTEEKFDPDSQVIRSEQRNSEKSNSSAPGGAPGTTSNLPAKTPPAAQQRTVQSEKKNDTVNYEINKVVSHVVSPASQLKRISVVVLVDGTYAASEGSNGAKDAKAAKELKYVPRSEETIQQLEDMVKNAVGYTAARGDEVKVVNMPFETAPQEEFTEADKPAASPIMPMAMTAARYAAPVVAVLLLFFVVVRPLMKALSMPSGIPQTQLQLPQSVAELERSLESKDRLGKGHLIEWAKKNPRDAASLVKGWMEER
jgi:flagellar M-ring protein FliF